MLTWPPNYPDLSQVKHVWDVQEAQPHFQVHAKGSIMALVMLLCLTGVFIEYLHYIIITYIIFIRVFIILLLVRILQYLKELISLQTQT